mmetsp:Transcript_96815/g.295956  ORF Transcript_96815/g.295956 Transcript_96815/m.295956 type:complete len:212 (+) Transcript_96815:644-1279(+)
MANTFDAMQISSVLRITSSTRRLSCWACNKEVNNSRNWSPILSCNSYVCQWPMASARIGLIWSLIVESRHVSSGKHQNCVSRSSTTSVKQMFRHRSIQSSLSWTSALASRSGRANFCSVRMVHSRHSCATAMTGRSSAQSPTRSQTAYSKACSQPLIFLARSSRKPVHDSSNMSPQLSTGAASCVSLRRPPKMRTCFVARSRSGISMSNFA